MDIRVDILVWIKQGRNRKEGGVVKGFFVEDKVVREEKGGIDGWRCREGEG